MTFTHPEQPVTLQDIENAEAILGITLPTVVRNLYLSTNGGCPEPYVFEDNNIDTVVAEFLPLKSERKGTALKSYEHLVLNKKLVPRQFFPFAIDGGGDYFFVDCSTLDGTVYFFRSESTATDRLLNLQVGFDHFWSLLREE